MTPQDKISEEMMKRARKLIATCWENNDDMSVDDGCSGYDTQKLVDAFQIFGQEMFERGAAQSSKTEWASEDETRIEMSNRPQGRIPMFGESYREGFMDGVEWLKQKLTPSQGEG